MSDKAKKPQMLEHLGLGNAVKFNALLGLQGWMEYATPALQVVIVPYLLGSTRELGTV